MKALFIILFSIGFLQSCEYNTIKAAPGGSNSIFTANPDTKIDFAFVSSQVKVCLDCHSAGKKSPELSSRQALIDNAADVLSEVNSDSMPPTSKGYASFTPCQKAALQKWYDMGAPDDSAVNVNTIPECATQTPPVVVTPPEEPPVVVVPPVTETMINFAFIQTKMAVCLNCHAAGKKEPELTTKQNLIDHADDILSEVLSDSMPPKKKFASFTACEKASLQKWYDMGAPDESNTAVNSLVECVVAP